MNQYGSVTLMKTVSLFLLVIFVSSNVYGGNVAANKTFNNYLVLKT